jgi:hypothetical protein
MKRYQVPVASVRPLGLKAQGELGDFVLVFAGDETAACFVAIDKMRDKYLRHQNMDTEWKVTGEPVEC